MEILILIMACKLLADLVAYNLKEAKLLYIPRDDLQNKIE